MGVGYHDLVFSDSDGTQPIWRQNWPVEQALGPDGYLVAWAERASRVGGQVRCHLEGGQLYLTVELSVEQWRELQGHEADSPESDIERWRRDDRPGVVPLDIGAQRRGERAGGLR